MVPLNTIPSNATLAQLCAAVAAASRVAPVLVPRKQAMKLEDHGCVLVIDDSQWRWVLTLTDKGSRLADSRPRRLQLVPKHRHERRPWRRYSDTLTERTDCEKVIVNRNGTVMAVLEADWTWVRRANARGGSDRKV